MAGTSNQVIALVPSSWSSSLPLLYTLSSWIFTYNLLALLVKLLRSYIPPLAGPTFSMDEFDRRDSTTCEGSKQWYVCSAGNFRGCCAMDPCTSGICLDDGLNWLSLSSTSSSTTSAPPSTSTVLRTSTSTVPVTSASQTTSSITKAVSSETSSTMVATTTESSSSKTTSSSSTTATAVASAGTKSSSKRPIIGGAIAGIVALILCILLFWFCWRRKRRHGKSYRVRLLRSRSDKSLHDREMASVSKTNLPPLENMSTNLHEESHNSCKTISPPSTTNAPTGTLSTTNSTTALSLTLSPDPSEYSTLSSAVLTTSSGGFIHLPPLRMPSPSPSPSSRNSLIPQTEPAAELSDTGFYRQRAELSANPSRELINVPAERRRGKSPLRQATTPGSSWASSPSPSSSSSNSNSSSPRSAVEQNRSVALTSRQTARRVVTRDGVVMGANLDRYPTVRDSGCGEMGKLDERDRDGNREHVMSFMTFGGSEFEMVRRDEGGSRVGGNGNGNGGTRAGLEDVGASPVVEAPPAYEAGGVSPKQDDKSPSGTMGMECDRRR